MYVFVRRMPSNSLYAYENTQVDSQYYDIKMLRNLVFLHVHYVHINLYLIVHGLHKVVPTCSHRTNNFSIIGIYYNKKYWLERYLNDNAI